MGKCLLCIWICSKLLWGLFRAAIHPPFKFCENPLSSFCVVMLIYQPANKQTNKQTNKQKWLEACALHSLFPLLKENKIILINNNKKKTVISIMGKRFFLWKSSQNDFSLQCKRGVLKRKRLEIYKTNGIRQLGLPPYIFGILNI